MKLFGNNYVKNIKSKIWLLIIWLLAGCQYFQKPVDKTPVAKIYDTYLYFEDITPAIYHNKSPDDSLNAIHQYIEDWAYRTLLLKQAERNVDTLKINHLVEQYRRDLLTDTYKDRLLQKYIDTVIPKDTLQIYYQKYRQYFISEYAFIKPKFLVVQKNHTKISKFKKWFFSDKPEYYDSLIKNTNSFSKYNLTADKWYLLPDFKTELPVFKHMNDRYILKKSKKFVLTDTLSLYLVFIKDVVLQNQEMPLSMVKDDLKQLVLSKRKQAALSRMENNIKQEAINKKIFKIFKTKHSNE